MWGLLSTEHSTATATRWLGCYDRKADTIMGCGVRKANHSHSEPSILKHTNYTHSHGQSLTREDQRKDMLNC
jgi:hypothetical protein